jgi:hypothetical protein
VELNCLFSPIVVASLFTALECIAFSPTFTQMPLDVPGFRTASLSWGDFDGDGDLDLLAGGYTSTGHELCLFRNDAGTLLRFVLTNLLAGAYYWSVQAVDLGYAASAFAAEAQFIIPAGLPRADDIAVSEMRYQHATLSGMVIPNGTETLAWFEYGPDTNYGSVTVPQVLGAGVIAIGITNELTALETAVTYRFRLMASNAVGAVASSEAAFVIANNQPSISVASRLTTFPNVPAAPLTILVTDVETLASQLQLTAVVAPQSGQNTNLLDASGIEWGGSGTNRTLTLTPVPHQRGVVRVLVTVTDLHGGQATKAVQFQAEDFTRLAWLARDPGDSVAWIDTDRDGWLDLVGNVSWLYNQKGTNLSGQTLLFPNSILGQIVPADANADGLVDFAITGTRSGLRMTQVFTNRPFATPSTLLFRGLPSPLAPGFTEAALAWADYDADGDADLFGYGSTNLQPASAFATQTWRNDGALQFTEVAGVLPRLSLGSMAWADFDGDGDLDVCVLGSTNRQSTGAFTRILRNDGDLDLAYCGSDEPRFPMPVFKLYLNTGGGVFADISPPDPQLNWPVAFADYDGDTDLDLASLTTLYRNNTSTTNVTPKAPAELEANVTSNEVLFTWAPATDANQPAALTYNLRVGTTPGGIDIVSPLADLQTGRRYVVAPGNAWQSGRWKLRNLAPGAYYWSVQAIDHSFAGGPFAAEQTFTVGSGVGAPRFDGIVLDPQGSLTLTVSVIKAGRFVLEASPDLRQWTARATHDLPSGPSTITVNQGTQAAGFFRLRQE